MARKSQDVYSDSPVRAACGCRWPSDFPGGDHSDMEQSLPADRGTAARLRPAIPHMNAVHETLHAAAPTVRVAMHAADHEPDEWKKLATHGRTVSGRGAIKMRGDPISCHQNTAALYAANRGRVKIMTGYARSRDGIWRAHSWGTHIASGRPIETTEPRTHYHGYALSRAESEKAASEW